MCTLFVWNVNKLEIYRNVLTSSVLRSFTTSLENYKSWVIPKSKSSNDWLKRHLNDPYVQLAHLKNYRARSAFKLLEINEKYKILKAGITVVECGAAPGAWTQVIVSEVKKNSENDFDSTVGTVISVDLLHFLGIEGAISMCGYDITSPKTVELIQSKLLGKKVDLVLSDMAPNASGNKALDHDIIIELGYSVMRFAIKNSAGGSSFLCKVWNGGRMMKFKSDLEMHYKNVKFAKPPASRSDSSEIYLLARNFKKETS